MVANHRNGGRGTFEHDREMSESFIQRTTILRFCYLGILGAAAFAVCKHSCALPQNSSPLAHAFGIRHPSTRHVFIEPPANLANRLTSPP